MQIHRKPFRWVPAAGLGAILVLGALVWWRVGLNRSQPDIPELPNPLSNLEAMLPVKSGPPGYVGSDSCKECHLKEYESWHASYHRSMTQVMTPASVKADFNDVALEHGGERFRLTREGEDFWVEISAAGASSAETSSEAGVSTRSGSTQEPLRIRMGLVTGSHHMQVFWLPGGFGNTQIGFPFTWLIDDQRWVPRHDAFIRDPDSPPSRELWNLTCIRCHTTAGRPRPDSVRQVYETSAIDLGISCEACHGPGENHVTRRQIERAFGSGAQVVSEGRRDEWIVHPGHLPSKAGSQICGACHGIKWFDKSEGWEQHGFRYRPGDDLESTTPVVRPNRIESQPWLASVLGKHPELLRDFFWPDGMIRVAGREYNGLTESPCFQRGELSCLSCHSMHKSDPNDQLARGMEGNAACLQCHPSIRDDLAGHTRHAPESSGSLCYNCHMPHTSYALLKSIRSHQIDSPDVQSTLDTGRLNACNLCHLDKSLTWTAAHLGQWFGKPQPELAGDDAVLSAAVLQALKGDAGQRAMMAWHMGWEAARSVSGERWIPPFLEMLMADPYSAVRYIAGKSLRRLPGYSGLQYDFVGTEVERDAARRRAIEIWLREDAVRLDRTGPEIPIDASGTLNQPVIERLRAARDDRPIRLRE